MKRSEMIIVMMKSMLNIPENIKNMNDGGQQLIRKMDYLLSILESEGMLPPKTEEVFEYYGCEDDEPEISTIYVNKWEPEDEI